MKPSISFQTIRIVTLVLALLIGLACPVSAFAAPTDPLDFDPESVHCYGFVLMDADTGQILLADDEKVKIHMASTTKVMTALLLLESGQDLNETYTCGNEVVNGFTSVSSLMGLKVGATVTYRDLLYGLLLPSGNDAAAAIAVGQAGSIQEFAKWMNERARQLGMTDTNFVNPHGIDHNQHMSTAYDMALLAREAMKNETFREVVSTPTYTVPANNVMGEIKLTNTNLLIAANPKYEDLTYEYCTGIKTGTTTWGKGCLLSSASKNGRNLIVSIMGDESVHRGYNGWYRFIDSVSLFEYGFALPEVDFIDEIKAHEIIAEVPGLLGKTKLLPQLDTDSIPFFGPEDTIADLQASMEGETPSYSNLECTVTIREDLPETLSADTVVGTASYTYQGLEIYTCDLMVEPSALPTPAPTVQPSQPSVTPSGDGENGPLPDRTLTRTFTIGLLIVAVLSVLVILITFITAPYRRRKQREKRAQAQKRLMEKRNDRY